MSPKNERRRRAYRVGFAAGLEIYGPGTQLTRCKSEGYSGAVGPVSMEELVARSHDASKCVVFGQSAAYSKPR